MTWWLHLAAWLVILTAILWACTLGLWHLVDALRAEYRARTPLCRCGHSRAEHLHYRSGSDCALCRCPKRRRP